MLNLRDDHLHPVYPSSKKFTFFLHQICFIEISMSTDSTDDMEALKNTE
jgi:hypothetical protein